MRCEIRRKGEEEVTTRKWPSWKNWLMSLFSLGCAMGILYVARTAEGFDLIIFLVGAGSCTFTCFDFARQALRER